ncbi:VOC family protein [Pseudomonas sp. NPDC090755]|uniref:VOC family protein n=1 Tax=Pseudomonas sp. NPDC090755 TaxID=3364481 RepID=UPI00383B8DF6
MPGNQIVSILLHTRDWRAATDWYAQAFPQAERIYPASDDYGLLHLAGVALEIINEDEKVSSGASGSVVYWRVDDLRQEVQRLEALGGRLYRGPLQIEGDEWIAQVRDPWGNCLGLRQVVS